MISYGGDSRGQHALGSTRRFPNPVTKVALVTGLQVGVRRLEAPSRDENLVRGAGAAAGRLSCLCPSHPAGSLFGFLVPKG